MGSLPVAMRNPYTNASALLNEHPAVGWPLEPDTDAHNQLTAALGLTQSTEKDNNPLINIPESACHVSIC
jgi:hypothetical protein